MRSSRLPPSSARLLRVPHATDTQAASHVLSCRARSVLEVVFGGDAEANPGQHSAHPERRDSDGDTCAQPEAQRGVRGLKQRYGRRLDIKVPGVSMRAQDERQCWNVVDHELGGPRVGLEQGAPSKLDASEQAHVSKAVAREQAPK